MKWWRAENRKSGGVERRHKAVTNQRVGTAMQGLTLAHFTKPIHSNN